MLSVEKITVAIQYQVDRPHQISDAKNYHSEILTAVYNNPSSTGDVPPNTGYTMAQEKRERTDADDNDVCKEHILGAKQGISVLYIFLMGFCFTRGKVPQVQDRTDFCWDPIIQNCFGNTNGFFSGSKQTLTGYNINALARSSLVGLVQTVKDHITKPTAMARGRVAHIIEWKGWGGQRRGCNTPPVDEDHYSSLTDELKEARFAAGVAEQFAITEATLSAWSSLDTEEVLGDSSLSNMVNYLNTEDIYFEDHSPNGSQGFYSLNVEGPCTVVTPVSSTVDSPASDPLQIDRASLQPANNTSLTGALTQEPPNCLYLPKASSSGVELHRTLRQSTGSHPHQSHSSNNSSLIEDDVFYN